MIELVYAVVYALSYIVYALMYHVHALLDILWHVPWLGADLRSTADLRVPRHLAVVFAWPNASRKAVHAALEDVWRLVQWCKQVGVAELTIYDKKGLLAEAVNALPDADNKTHIGLEAHFGLNARGEMPSARRLLIPSTSVDVPLHLSLLSHRDDKTALTFAMQHCQPITPSGVDKSFLAHSPMLSAPDILMVCDAHGGPPRLHGFPCWTVRLTTIGSLPSWSVLRSWTPMHFLDTLKLYTSAEQRHGA